MSAAVYVLYATRELGIGPAALGGIVAAGGPPALLSAILSGRIVGRFGAGPALVAAQLLSAGPALLVPLGRRPRAPGGGAARALAGRRGSGERVHQCPPLHADADAPAADRLGSGERHGAGDGLRGDGGGSAPRGRPGPALAVTAMGLVGEGSPMSALVLDRRQ